MISAPYYLLAVGICTLIGGYFLAVVVGPARPDQISEHMSDDEIVESLQSQQRGHWTDFVVLAGYLLIG